MDQQEREQRINLRIEDISIPLTVPASRERYYRHAGEELALTAGLYRNRYPKQRGLHLLMAAIDVAYRGELWRESVSTRGLADRLETLARKSEETWVKHQALLEHLQQRE